MPTINPTSPEQEARAALGHRLRDLRREQGLTARALAGATGQHFTRVSKIENGVQRPSDTDIWRWCRACGADDQAEDLVATARAVDTAYVEFRRQGRADMKRVLGPHTRSRYDSTRTFRIYEHNVVPGLFQTAEYTAAMLSFWIDFLGTPDDLAEAVAVRMERQRVIYQSRRRIAAVIEEQALRTWFGTAQVQAGQLDRLLAVMSLPAVSLGVIPMMCERDGVSSAGFWIFDESLVALEIPSASIEITRPQEIRLYTTLFDRLSSTALHGTAARDLIRKAAEELY